MSFSIFLLLKCHVLLAFKLQQNDVIELQYIYCDIQFDS